MKHSKALIEATAAAIAAGGPVHYDHMSSRNRTMYRDFAKQALDVAVPMVIRTERQRIIRTLNTDTDGRPLA